MMHLPAPVYLHAIGTAVPANRLPQTTILEFMKRPHREHPSRLAFLDKIYAGSAIEWRHSVLADYGRPSHELEFFPTNDSLDPAPGTGVRNDRYIKEAEKLAIQACTRLFGPVGQSAQPEPGPASPWPHLPCRPLDISHLITVSCTGFSAPGFDLALIQTLGLDPAVQRTHIGFMGCNAAFPALSLASDIATAHPEARILIVSVEICTLHFQAEWNPERMVANALFADGAAAALVSARFEDSGAPLFAIGQRQSRILPDSASRMAWSIGDRGFDMTLSAYVPRLIEAKLGHLLDEILASAGLKRDRISHWAIHPGGRAILDRVAEGLGLSNGALDPSYAILREYGNMSSATMFFVLQRLAAMAPAGGIPDSANSATSPAPAPELVFATSFGPGLSIESALLELFPRPPVTRPALFFPRLAQRCLEPELMDDSRIDRPRLKRTIHQFRLLNFLFSAYRGILGRELFARLDDREKTWRVLDIGCGGGDILAWLATHARRKGWKLELTGIDPDHDTVAWARQSLAAWPEITIIQASGSDLASLGDFDFIISNHVLHHLSRRQIVALLRACDARAGRNLIINDLERSRWAYIGYTIFTGLLIHRSLAFYDGRLSIRRAFTRHEMSELITQAGLAGRLHLKTRHPARLYTSRFGTPE